MGGEGRGEEVGGRGEGGVGGDSVLYSALEAGAEGKGTYIEPSAD